MPQFYSIIGRLAAMPAAWTSLRRPRCRLQPALGLNLIHPISSLCGFVSGGRTRDDRPYFSLFPQAGEGGPVLKAREGEGLLPETGHEI
jgi:hypothetical protein